MLPRKGTIAARRYKGLINARPYRIENDRHVVNENSHLCFATVNCYEELFVMFSEEGQLFDCDNMNKTKMNGTTAVSRYHQPLSYFLSNDIPNIDDHDFPVGANYSATISGYLRIQQDALAAKYSLGLSLGNGNDAIDSQRVIKYFGLKNVDGIYYDKFDRLHIEIPRTGQLHLVCRANLFHVASVETHLNDFISIFGGELPPALGIRADRGPDWGPQNLLNVIFFGRLFLDFNMDVLSLFYLAANNSAFGKIERIWSTVSKWLAGT